MIAADPIGAGLACLALAAELLAATVAAWRYQHRSTRP